MKPSDSPASDVLAALLAVAERPAAPEAREALAAALAFRHHALPAATPARGGTVVPFPRPARRPAAAGRTPGGARPAGTVRRLPVAREEAGPPTATDAAGLVLRLVPESAPVAGVDAEARGLRAFRVLAPGAIAGKPIPAGAHLLVARREVRPGDAVVVATRTALGVPPPGPLPAGARTLGVVEAVLR